MTPRHLETTALARRLIAQNKRPTVTENATLQTAISALRDTVRKLNAQFNDIDFALAVIPPDAAPDAELKTQYAQLQQELDSAQELLAIHTTAITLIRQIPVEVLEIIFVFTLPRSNPASPSKTEAPLLLGQICCAWRRVALTTPRLWSSLSLSLDRRPGEWRHLIETWLGRSGDCPLTMSFIKGTNSAYYFNEHVIRMLRPYAKRWRHLLLDLSAVTTVKLLSTTLPLLETIQVNTQGESAGLYLSTADVPRLKRVHFVGDRLHPKGIQLPYRQLTDLRVQSAPCSLDDVYRILTNCQNLVQCAVSISSTSTATQNSLQHRPVHLPHLRELTVKGSIATPAIASFFPELRTPKLETLELVNITDSESGSFGLHDESPLAVFARASNIRKLTLLGDNPEADLFQMVVAIPSLREVLIGNVDGGDVWTPENVRHALEMRGEPEV
ncbi:F-box domain-containing protein [Mycena indigotica]|uniref:F-box domain-containing protein n=1 Tax=Mycena indigotica TaxID=2126181 RepID=A0A8H6TCB1_9AGAR|nr:F-box domain-containing protein [Mycena indigotica]KAF7315068.1 F-box domain-containing protein [Mycena indigotica]